MADINIVGIDLSTGQLRPLESSDFISDSSTNPLQGATGLPGVTGIASGQTGVVGSPGVTGVQGITGIRPAHQGITGAISSATGILGVTGTAVTTPGVQGLTGLQGAGSYSILTGATTITADAYIVGLDSTGGPFTVTLPDLTAFDPGYGKVYVLQDQTGQANTNNVIISAPANLFFYTDTTYVINQPYQAVEIYNDAGGSYFAISFNIGYTGLAGLTGMYQGETGIQGQTGI